MKIEDVMKLPKKEQAKLLIEGLLKKAGCPDVVEGVSISQVIEEQLTEDMRKKDFVFVGEWTEEEKMKKRLQIYALINRELIPYDSKMVIEKEKI